MEPIQTNSEEQEYDVVEKARELYSKLEGSISTEKLLELKDFIKEFSDNCRTYNMFKDAQTLYDDFVAELMKVGDSEKRLMYAWNHLDSKLAVAPTFVHFKATIVLLIPLINHAIENYIAPDDVTPNSELDE